MMDIRGLRLASMVLLLLSAAVAASAMPLAQAQSKQPQGTGSGWTVSTVDGTATAAPILAPLTERVGRVAVMVGAAQVWSPQERQWTPLQVNRMVTAGDRIRTEVQSQIELQVGSLELFLGPQSDLEFLRMDLQGTHAHLVRGSLAARVQTVEWARDLHIATPELSAMAAEPGLYRIDRDAVSGGRSAAASLRGLLLVALADSRLQVAAGQRIEVMGASAVDGQRSTSLLQDAFSAWVAARDQAPPVIGQAAVIAPLREMTGLDALDLHGRWESHPEQGWVWYPIQVRPGWEPFRDGRWVWVNPWGWTWVDDAPWGFAPSHYGRWMQWNGRWVWAPGAVRVRPLPPVLPIPAPVLRPREERPPPEWRGDYEHRSVRTPRVDGGRPGSAPPGLWTAPSPGAAAPAPALSMPGTAEDRPSRPERRHGVERPPSEPRPAERAPKPQERDRGDKTERAERQRQLAQ